MSELSPQQGFRDSASVKRVGSEIKGGGDAETMDLF